MKKFLPRGLYGRAALILILPIVAIQLVVSTAFIQRHFEGVTRQMTQGVAIDLKYVLAEFARGTLEAPEAGGLGGFARAQSVAAPLQITLRFPATEAAPHHDIRDFDDLSGRAIISSLREEMAELRAADVSGSDRIVRLRIATPQGDLEANLARRRMAATNPHQLLVLMILTSVFMTLIAYAFLRNQLKPIWRLAQAAEAFGRGERASYRPRGAVEVRAAGRAFLEMRARIERQLEQRTLMLSGISHDLRTPLTRMKLSLAFLPEDEETDALKADVVQMERLVDEFLAFVRGDATEGEEACDLDHLLTELVADANRAGGAVTLAPREGRKRPLSLRPQALRRAVDNLVANGLRHGAQVRVTLRYRPASVDILVEDDGPGIPEAQREEAMRPFTRLGAARDPNRGGGVGLGLSIATDIALSHGGRLSLGHSAALGGLLVTLTLAR